MSAPTGFINLFPGWNVWGVVAKNDLEFETMMVGLSPERRLRIWVEEAADAAPGVAVGDPANPLALKGAQIELLQGVEGLDVDDDISQMKPGMLPLWEGPASTTRRLVRFYNRGAAGVTPWPQSNNFIVQTVFAPDASNPITGGPPPASLAGTASAVVGGAGEVLKVVAIVGGVVVVAGGLAWLLSRQRSMAA